MSLSYSTDNEIMASIAIITYNQEAYIAKAIESVINQKFNYRYEIVIGEDCSTDNTRSVVAEYQKRYPEIIKIVTSDHNVGLVRNMKRTYDACVGKYLCPLGGDDEFSSSQKLSRQIEVLENDQNIGLVHTNGHMIYAGDSQKNKVYHATNITAEYQDKLFERLLQRNFIIASSVCMRQSLYRKHINMEEFCKLGFLMEDYPSWLELSRITKFAYIDECMVTCLRLDNSLSRQTEIKKQYTFMKSVSDVKMYFINKYGCPENVRDLVLYQTNYFELKYSFFLNDGARAKDAFKYLAHTSSRPLTMDMYLFYIASLSPLLWRLINKIYKFKKLLAPKISVQKIINKNASV